MDPRDLDIRTKQPDNVNNDNNYIEIKYNVY